MLQLVSYHSNYDIRLTAMYTLNGTLQFWQSRGGEKGHSFEGALRTSMEAGLDHVEYLALYTAQVITEQQLLDWLQSRRPIAPVGIVKTFSLPEECQERLRMKGSENDKRSSTQFKDVKKSNRPWTFQT